MFSPDPIQQQRMPVPPSSSTPLRDYVSTHQHGVHPNYVVLPRAVAESMPLPWQQQLVHLLSELHQATDHLPWPIYRVTPSKWEMVADLDDEQLAAEGFSVEMDEDGKLVYRDKQDHVVKTPEETRILVACPDPLQTRVQNRPGLPPTQSGPHPMPPQGTPAQGFPAQPPGFPPQANQQPQGWR